MELYLMPRKKRVKYSNGGLAIQRHVNIAGMDTTLDTRVGLAPETGKPVGSVGVQVPSRGLHSEVYGDLGGPQHVTTSVQDTFGIGGTTVGRVNLDTNKYTIMHHRDIKSLDAGLTVFGGTEEDSKGTFGFELSLPFGN